MSTIDSTVDARAPAFGPRWWIAMAGLPATAAGLAIHGTWRVLPFERALLVLVLALLAGGVAWLLRKPLRCSAATAIAAVWLAGAVAHVGAGPMLAATLLALAGAAIGLGLVGAGTPARLCIATVVGLLLIAMVGGWMVTLPIHSPWAWGALLVAVVVARRHALLAALREAASGWRVGVTGHPRASALVVMLLGVASVAAWIPTLQADDIGYHLGLPTQLMAHARYQPMPAHQVWAYAPWAGDVLHGIVFVLSRQPAHGAMCMAWLVLAAGAAWSLARAAGAHAREGLGAVALLATFPPLVWMAAGMQTELPATATLLALAAVCIAPAGGDARPRRLFAGVVLVAGLFALKPVHGLAALPLVLLAAWRQRRGVRVRWIVAACLLFVLCAGSSYAQAWRATGNPVLPLFNQFFGSPYFPAAQFADPRWQAARTLDLPWQLTFHTSRYVEGWDGGLGFALVALAGLFALQVASPPRRWLVVASACVAVLPLVAVAYARYAWPGIALLLVLLPVGAGRWLSPRALGWLLAAVCALNLAFQANASWLHHSAVVKRTLRSGGDIETVTAPYLPDLVLLRAIPAKDRALVLAADPARNIVAGLAGRGRTASPHDPALQAAAMAADADASGAAWAALLRRESIGWVVVAEPATRRALMAGLASNGATRARALRGAELWHLPPAAQDPRP